MSQYPLEMLETIDPELHNVIVNTFEFALSEGALSKKF